MFYELRDRKTDNVDMIVSDSVCIIAAVMVEGPIKGVAKPGFAFLPGPGVPPISCETHYANPIESWPSPFTAK